MLRLCLLALLSNSSIMALAITIPLLVEKIGLSYAILGLIGFSYGLFSVISYYFFGKLSDSLGKRKIFLIVGFLLSAVSFFLHVFARDSISLILVRAFSGLTVGIFSFPLIAYAHDNFGSKGVSWVSAFSSLGWAVGSLIVGLIKYFNEIFILSAVSFLIAFLLTINIKDSKVKPLSVSIFPKKLIKKNIALYSLYFARHVGACSIWIIFPIYLLSLGANMLVLGIIYAMNPLTQTFAMLSIPKIKLKMSTKSMIRLGIMLSFITFLIYYLSVHYISIIPAQFILGIAWAFLYVGSLLYLLERNIEKATSTGLLGSTISLSNMFGVLIGGMLATYSLKLPMIFACALCLVSMAISSKL